MKSAAQPADLDSLAAKCEALAMDKQGWGLAQVLSFLRIGSPGNEAAAEPASSEAMWVRLLADSGAHESAAFALLPADCTYSCARLSDGTHVAQVILRGGVGAHSRGAKTLSMAVTAALLRALGREIVERRYLA